MRVVRPGTLSVTEEGLLRLSGWVVDCEGEWVDVTSVAGRKRVALLALQFMADRGGIELEPLGDPQPTADHERALQDALAVMRWGPTA